MFHKIMKNPLSILTLIILIGVFFRAYFAFDWFEFNHDGDLYSWIIKDILVDGHIRLIGQLTSTPGIFIGSLFYYSLVPFYYFSGMNPLSLVFYSISLSVVVLISYYYVFKRLFDTNTALIACFLQAVLMSRVMYDRWVVPTVLSSLWEIWFLFAVVMLAQKKYISLPILGILTGLIWHINFGLLPTFLAVIAAIVMSRRIPPFKWIFFGVLVGLIVNVPLFIFEYKHSFQQFHALFGALTIDQGGGQGYGKWIEVIMKVSGNIYQQFLYPGRGVYPHNFILIIFSVFLTMNMFRGRWVDRKIIIIFYTWVLGVLLFFASNSKIISEYYFQNIGIVFLSIVAITLNRIYKKSIFWKKAVLGLLGFILIVNLWVLTTVYEYNHLGYKERKQVADFIRQDAANNGYPCVAISYVTSPGNNFGFRYVFYQVGLKVKPVVNEVPVYTIGIPEEKIPLLPTTRRFGAIRVNTPDNFFDVNKLDQNCSGFDWNLEDSLFGFYK